MTLGVYGSEGSVYRMFMIGNREIRISKDSWIRVNACFPKDKVINDIAWRQSFCVHVCIRGVTHAFLSFISGIVSKYFGKLSLYTISVYIRQ